MTAPDNIAIPCAVSRRNALIAYRGVCHPQSVTLRFVTSGPVIDYAADPARFGRTLPLGAVDVRALVRFLTDPTPPAAPVGIDQDLTGQWEGERACIVYHVDAPYGPAMVFLAREDATRLASWMREVAGLQEPTSN